MEDFQEIVKKFLSRENTYSQLLEAVTDAEKRKEQLRQENEKLSEELQKKCIELDGLRGRNEEGEVFQLQKQLTDMGKEEQNLLEKYQLCSIVYDQLRGWVLKTYQMLLGILEGSSQHASELQKLRALDLSNTEAMFIGMCGLIEQLSEQYGHVQGDKVTIKALLVQDEFDNDEEYKAKNIRVHQKAKQTLKREDSFHSTQGPSALGSIPVADINEAEQDQKIINSEFRDDRKNVRAHIKKKVLGLGNE